MVSSVARAVRSSAVALARPRRSAAAVENMPRTETVLRTVAAIPAAASFKGPARSLITLWTKAGNFTFQADDRERGPILAPEYGFFVRAVSPAPAGPYPFVSKATTAAEFQGELAKQGLKTVRSRVRERAEPTWGTPGGPTRPPGTSPSGPLPPRTPAGGTAR